MKNHVIILILLFLCFVTNSQNVIFEHKFETPSGNGFETGWTNIPTTGGILSQNQNIISNFQHFTPQQLYYTANHFFNCKSSDTAFVCFNLFVNTPVKKNDFVHQKNFVEALNKISIIYFHSADYLNSYGHLIRALYFCEKYNYDSYLPKIYINIGNIYYQYNKYDITKQYYLKALNLPLDTISIITLLSNLGAVELESENLDSAAYYLTKSLQISKKYNDFLLPDILNNKASLFQKKGLYDSAYYYYHASLNVARKNEKYAREAQSLLDLGSLFIEINKLDSALIYIDLSNNVAKTYNFTRIIAENYLLLSNIEEAKGRKTAALDYYRKYAELKDSVFGVENFSGINQLQRSYEVSKTNAQIERLVVEKQYQKIIWFITSIILLIVSVALLLLFFQNKRLNAAYKTLFDKNIRIIELQKSSNPDTEKYQKSALTDEMQNELLQKILTIMENTAAICDTEFSLDKLAELVQSNHTYVSQVINTGMKKNFRSFLNGYRIQEAQRLFSELDLSKYTIAAIALEVGFKSPAAFRSTFKEITGVSPNFYLKAMQKQNITF
jgi:AraC-like DNA-binding protein